MDLRELKQLIKEVWKSGSRKNDVLLESPDSQTLLERLDGKFLFKALFVLGPAGSGKTYLIKNQLNIPYSPKGSNTGNSFAYRNPDEAIEDKFPEVGLSMKFVNDTYDPDKEQQVANEKEKYAQQMSRKIIQQGSRSHTANLLSVGAPMLFDTTGEDVGKMSARMEQLTKLGYDVGIFMNMVPEDASVERDQKRDRTVGKDITSQIHQKYAQDVMQLKGFAQSAGSNENVTVFAGGEVYWNVFDLDTGELLQKPTVITPEMLPDDINPEKNPEAYPKYKAMIEQATGEIQSFVSGDEPNNPKGKALLSAMKKLNEMSGGQLGRNMYDLGTAAYLGEPYVSDEVIMKGLSVLEAAGGVEISKDVKTGRTGASPAKDQKATASAIRGKKDTKGQTMRGLARGVGSDVGPVGAKPEGGRMTESALAQLIADEIYEVLYGTTDRD